MAEIKPSEVTSILRQQLQNFNLKTEMEETGTVLLVGDGIARVYGLNNARSGELVTFETKAGGAETVTGIALNLEEDNVGVVLLGDSKSLNEGHLQTHRPYRIHPRWRRSSWPCHQHSG